MLFLGKGLLRRGLVAYKMKVLQVVVAENSNTKVLLKSVSTHYGSVIFFV